MISRKKCGDENPAIQDLCNITINIGFLKIYEECNNNMIYHLEPIF